MLEPTSRPMWLFPPAESSTLSPPVKVPPVKGKKSPLAPPEPVIVKLGYVPVIDTLPAPVKATVWSGDEFVTVIEPEPVTGEPDTEIPVPAVIPTEVTVPAVEEVPAPMAVLKLASVKASTVLLALILINLIAEGLANFTKF